MFAIDRQQPRAVLARGTQYQIPGADQRFLVGQCERCPLSERRKSRCQTGRTDDGGHHPVTRPRGGLGQGRRPCGNLDPGVRQRRAQVAQQLFMGCHRDLRLQRARIRSQLRDVVPAGQSHDVIPVQVAGDQVNRVLPDRPGGAENGDTSHQPVTRCPAAARTKPAPETRRPRHPACRRTDPASHRDRESARWNP